MVGVQAGQERKQKWLVLYDTRWLSVCILLASHI
jgi:hypothetical protein